jgi:hypothetical protein
MKFALLQAALTPPPPDRLKRALSQTPGLTALDAPIIINDAYGILLRNREHSDAVALQGRLRSEGIETELVPEPDLPALPPTKFLQRLDCAPAGLTLYDALGRGFAVDWNHVWLIAAGAVVTVDFRQIEVVDKLGLAADEYGYTDLPKREIRSREERRPKLLLELILGRGAIRYSVSAERFQFHYLGDRRTPDQATNFRLLLQDLTRLAPHAWLNRGAQALKDPAHEPVLYPTRNAFFEEIIWLLWKMLRSPR